MCRGCNLFIQVALTAICILFLSCKKEEKQINSNPMKQLFYTQEGNPYILKTANKTSVLSIAAPQVLYKQVIFNSESLGAFPEQSIGISAVKKIIPVSYTISAFLNAAGTLNANISECYYITYYASTSSTKNRSCLAKSVPLIDRVFYTDDANHGYSFRYSQAVYSDTDFLDTDNLTLYMVNTLDRAMCFQYDQASPSLAAADYTLAITFTYFEML